MDRAYENNKTIALTKAHGFCTVSPPKQIVDPVGSTTNNFINNEIFMTNLILFLFTLYFLLLFSICFLCERYLK